MLGKVIKLVKRQSFISKLFKVACVVGAAVLGGVVVNKIKTSEESGEKKSVLSYVMFVKSHWRKLAALFLVGWGFGIWAGIRTLIDNNKMEVSI